MSSPEVKYTKIFIDNKWVDARSGKTFDTFNPHDESVIAKVAEGDKADIHLAVAAAKRAFHRNSEWRLLDAVDRCKLINKFGDLILRDAEYLAQLETYNNGMVLNFSRHFLMVTVEHLRYIASLADKIQGETLPVGGDLFSYTLKQPVGVCGLILPWNGPIVMFTWKVATALAAGCTVVVKPAEQTPLTALALAALIAEAGFPPGVVNVVPGYGETAGASLTHHPDVRKISFTGSVEVGKLVQQAAGASNLKRVTLELGGKSPLVIMDDADLKKAVPYAAQAVFNHQGQMCIAASRLFVHSKIYDEFVEKAVEYARSIKIGNPTEPTTQQGPQADIHLAVAAAKRAFHRNSEWRLLDAVDRCKLINKFGDLILRDAEYLAQLETYNNGMVLNFSRHFLMVTVEHLRYIASLADKIQGETLPVGGDLFSYTLKQPVGVCGLILPWNGPIVMFTWKVATALAAGCTVVVKPAEQTPLTALALAALIAEAGFPPGVVNVVPGYGETAGASLTHHPDVRKISFTGSVEVGKLVQQAAGASNLKRVTLELGGKSPLVIMDDADLKKAVPYAAQAVFNHQGQMCIAASRLFVHSKIYDEFVEKAVEYARSIKIGNPTEPTTQQGPQVDKEMMTKILNYIETGKKEGAKLLTGGKRVGNTGSYIEPTIFGPVQSILKFDSLEEVIDRANNTNYGLAAGIFTSSLETALQFSKHVEAGTVWINTYLEFGPQVPFGGFKESGIGRENGLKSVDAYLEVKAVTINVPKKL